MDPKALVSIIAQGAIFLVVASFALQARAGLVFDTMRQAPLVLRGIVAVNIVVPAVAVALCALVSLDPAVETGIVVMAVSPLAPLAPGKMRKGGADISQVIGLYVALILCAVIIVPLTVAILSVVLPVDASLPVVTVAMMVAKTILLPVVVGVAVASYLPDFARAAARICALVGYAGVLLLLCLIAYAQRGAAAALMGDGTALVMALVVCAGILAGDLLGRPDPAMRNALAMAAAIRHPGIAALIVQSNFNDPRILLAVVLFLVISVIATSIYQVVFRRRKGNNG